MEKSVFVTVTAPGQNLSCSAPCCAWNSSQSLRGAPASQKPQPCSGKSGVHISFLCMAQAPFAAHTSVAHSLPKQWQLSASPNRSCNQNASKAIGSSLIKWQFPLLHGEATLKLCSASGPKLHLNYTQVRLESFCIELHLIRREKIRSLISPLILP